MNRYAFDLTCPRCGSEMEHRRSVVLEEDRSQAETWCARCLVVWRIDLRMEAADDLGSILTGFNDAAMRERAGQALSVDLIDRFQ